MTALIPLHFDQADIRMVIRDGEAWWVLRDLCAVLRIKNHRDAATRLWDWQKDGVGISDAIGRQQKTIIVNEAGAYSLILDSKRPEAERFARWLFQEVLPSIRKHGSYPPPTIAFTPTVDQETPWDGREKTLGERFREERLRVEAENGFELAHAPNMSKHVIRAIEDNMGGIRNKNRIEYLTYAGMDVLYIMTGERTLTPSERALRDAYRIAPSDQRELLLARADSLRLAHDVDVED